MPRNRAMSVAGERPEGLQDFAARQILKAIFSGELGPGDKLSPTKLAEELQISHIPVREALSGLAASGPVERIPRVGFFVAALSLDYLEDVYYWRQILEEEAHRMVVRNLTDGDLDRMREIDGAIIKAPTYGEQYIQLKREFHFVPFERTGSPTLLDFLNRLWDVSTRYVYLMSASAVPPGLLLAQQKGLMEAFEARNAKLVNSWMVEHRQVTMNAIREMVSSLVAEGARAGV